MSDRSRGDGPLPHPGVHFPPPLLFVVPLFAGALLHRWQPLHLIPAEGRAVGVLGGWLLIGIWVVITGWAVFTFKRQRTGMMPNTPATGLVTWGPYRYSRNPMYVALTVLYLGVTALMNTLWPVFFLPVALASVYFVVIRREERYLSSAFGHEYDSYCSTTRRWL